MSETVLFVDDSTYWTDSIAQALRAEGYVVSVVHDGLSAVERLRREPPHILITDYFLENLDGGKLCQIAKSYDANPPIRTIILTGGADRNLSRVPSKFADAVIAKNSTDIVLGDLRRILRDLRDPSLAPRGDDVVGHDRLEPRAVARKLHGLKQYLDALHEGIGDAVVGIDADRRVYFINSMSAELFELKEEEALAKPLHTVLRIPEDHPVMSLVEEALHSRSKPQRPVTVEIANSTLRITVAGLMSPNGRSTALLIARDISDLKAAELQRKNLDARLHEADKMASLGHLVAGISHEVNNPLAAIILNLGGFKAELSDVFQAWELERHDTKSKRPDGVSAHLNEMQRILEESFAAAERIRSIVAEMRLFAHPGTSAGDRMQVSELLDAAIALIASEVRYKARIIRDYGSTPDIVVDQARLGQAFLNVILNAAQAIEGNDPESNWIRIRTFCADDGVCVEVSNSGPLIAESALGKIFDPFFTTKPVGKGVGLGLSVAYETLRRHGGYIEAFSDETTPTTFKLWLPMDTGLALHSLPVRPVEERVSGSILLVDDDKLVRNSLRRILEKDHEIVLASSGVRALELLKERQFDVVLCDLIMPGMTGMELFDRVQMSQPEQASRFVFLTGGTSSAEARDFLQSVGNPRAYKPLSAEEIVDLVHRALRALSSSVAAGVSGL